MTARGIIANIGARLLWGGSTFYFSLSSSTDSRSLFVFRVLCAFLFVVLVCICMRQGTVVVHRLLEKRTMLVCLLSSMLIASNWFVVIDSLTSGHLLYASLGFYISPILTVCCGIIFLGERFNTLVALSLALCATAVLVLFHGTTALPWQVLYIAGTSTAYAYVRKLRPLPAVITNVIETGIAAIAAPAIFLAVSGGAWRLDSHGDGLVYLAGLGIVTTVPMLLYVYSLDKISLAAIGYLQYVTPTLMLLISVMILHETVSPTRVLAIALIWGSIISWIFAQQQGVKARVVPRALPTPRA
jgi:chloramphenicol-sensitive protein RarD